MISVFINIYRNVFQTVSKLPTRRELWNEQLSDVDELEREGSRSENGSRKEHLDSDHSWKCSFENERYRRSESDTR
uniref:Ovule protein n=1 Tax=Ascaris lumbricoides TaxID=6252 RepID=A0A0M3HJR0_ASCLU